MRFLKDSSLGARFRQLSQRPRFLLTAGVVLVLLVAGALALRGGAASVAQSSSNVGFVDWSQVQVAFLQPKLKGSMTELSELQSQLQTEFDEKSKEMNDEEKQELFEEYQGRLNEKVQAVQELEAQYVDQALKAIASQAAKEGVGLVLQKEAVVHGGVDLTPSVLQALGAEK